MITDDLITVLKPGKAKITATVNGVSVSGKMNRKDISQCNRR